MEVMLKETVREFGVTLSKPRNYKPIIIKSQLKISLSSHKTKSVWHYGR